jgi:hypothetical protein
MGREGGCFFVKRDISSIVEIVQFQRQSATSLSSYGKHHNLLVIKTLQGLDRPSRDLPVRIQADRGVAKRSLRESRPARGRLPTGQDDDVPSHARFMGAREGCGCFDWRWNVGR